MADTLYKIPSYIQAGMTYIWETSSGDYPTADYTGKCSIKYIGSSAATILTATESSNIYTFTLTAAVTEVLTIGEYEWTEYVEQGSGASIIRYILRQGRTAVRRFLATAGTVDSRSSYKTALDAIEAVLLGRASKDQEQFTIAGRTLVRTNITDLIKLRDFYSAKVVEEEREAAIAGGNPPSGKVLIQFKTP
jgi:hypothetical protein